MASKKRKGYTASAGIAGTGAATKAVGGHKYNKNMNRADEEINVYSRAHSAKSYINKARTGIKMEKAGKIGMTAGAGVALGTAISSRRSNHKGIDKK